jgi:chaperonin cofactor prefoldin
VYKLIGPMLAKQDVLEATTNVTKRLEYINAERYARIFVDFQSYIHKCVLHRTRLEKAADVIEKKFDTTQKDIQILQQRIQSLSTAAAGQLEAA